jgi:cytochrome b
MSRKLNNDQRELLSKTMVDIGKLVFAALVLAQIFSEKAVNVLLSIVGYFVLATLILTALYLLRDQKEK